MRGIVRGFARGAEQKRGTEESNRDGRSGAGLLVAARPLGI